MHNVSSFYFMRYEKICRVEKLTRFEFPSCAVKLLNTLLFSLSSKKKGAEMHIENKHLNVSFIGVF